MNRVGLAVAVAALACGGGSGGDDSAGGAGVDWAATQSLPTRDYGEAVTGNQYSETAGGITDALWVVGEDAPAGMAAQPNRAQLELPEAAPAGVIGLWVVSQIAVQQAGERANWSLYTVELPRRDAALGRLRARGFGAAVYYRRPLHVLYRTGQRLPGAERAARRVLSLPVHPGVSEDDLRAMARIAAGS